MRPFLKGKLEGQLPLFPLFPVFPLFFDGADRSFNRKYFKLLMCWIAYRNSRVYNSTFVLFMQEVLVNDR